MALIKVLFKNADGFDQEHSEAGDSIKMASFDTANASLTDAALSDLVGGVDANGRHTHDAAYFKKSEAINTSAGAADAAKPVKTNAAGYLNDLINNTTLNAALSHSSLTNLSADDHTMYLKADGSRNLSAIQSYATHPTFSSNTQLVDKKYVDDLQVGSTWLNAVISKVATPPGSPVAGDRYLVIATATGAFAGKETQIAQWSGSAWVFTVPVAGNMLSVNSDSTGIYLFGGVSWQVQAFESTTASGGLQKVGVDISLASGVAGAALGLTAGVLDVKVDGVGVEVVSDALQLKDLGVKAAKIDFGTGAGQVKAASIPIADAGGYTANTEVESAIQELFSLVHESGVSYTVAAGGVTKGFPIYVSAANTVTEFGALTNNKRIVGLANATLTNGQTVKAIFDDVLVTGVLSAAVVGMPVYWSGTALTQTIPSGSGSHVWELGVAANATDLHVNIKFVKKNA
jgi:hypothetical protein